VQLEPEETTRNTDIMVTTKLTLKKKLEVGYSQRWWRSTNVRRHLVWEDQSRVLTVVATWHVWTGRMTVITVLGYRKKSFPVTFSPELVWTKNENELSRLENPWQAIRIKNQSNRKKPKPNMGKKTSRQCQFRSNQGRKFFCDIRATKCTFLDIGCVCIGFDQDVVVQRFQFPFPIWIISLYTPPVLLNTMGSLSIIVALTRLN